MTELGTKVDPRSVEIAIDGQPLRLQRMRYVLLNKPTGYITTTSDERGRRTVMDLVPSRERIYPVGRLDRDTEGLLLLTNDGDVANRVMHPRYQLAKEYHVLTLTRPSDEKLERVRQGVVVDGRRVEPEEFRILRETRGGLILKIVVHEGIHHVVRRMMETVGIAVTGLRRVRVGPLSLAGVAVGESRELTPGERATLFEALRLEQESAATFRGWRAKGPRRRRGGGAAGAPVADPEAALPEAALPDRRDRPAASGDRDRPAAGPPTIGDGRRGKVGVRSRGPRAPAEGRPDRERGDRERSSGGDGRPTNLPWSRQGDASRESGPRPTPSQGGRREQNQGAGPGRGPTGTGPTKVDRRSSRGPRPNRPDAPSRADGPNRNPNRRRDHGDRPAGDRADRRTDHPEARPDRRIDPPPPRGDHGKRRPGEPPAPASRPRRPDRPDERRGGATTPPGGRPPRPPQSRAVEGRGKDRSPTLPPRPVAIPRPGRSVGRKRNKSDGDADRRPTGADAADEQQGSRPGGGD